jgi:hypothetical protein
VRRKLRRNRPPSVTLGAHITPCFSYPLRRMRHKKYTSLRAESIRTLKGEVAYWLLHVGVGYKVRVTNRKIGAHGAQPPARPLDRPAEKPDRSMAYD